MKKSLVILFSFVLFILSSCDKDDRAEIEELLEQSFFASEWIIGGLDDKTSEPRGYELSGLPGSFPSHIKFARRLERPIPRHWEIDIIDDSAYVTLNPEYIKGNFYVQNRPKTVWVKAINDTAHSEIILKKIDRRWRFYAFTITQFWSLENGAKITIKNIEVKASPSGNYFLIDDPYKFYKREELPWFEPADTVWIKVVASVSGDSCWVFLHHGRAHIRGAGRHHRDPLKRTSIKDSIFTFEGTWYIADDIDTILDPTPCIRHAFVDVIGGSSLYEATDYPYFARVWHFPYIIKHKEEPLPEDREGE